MNVLEPSQEDSTFFKFPFTDSENANLNLPKNYHQFQGLKTSPKRNCGDNVGSSSDLDFGLSPIARNRDSDTSIKSCEGSIEGQLLALDSNDSVENEKQSGNRMEDKEVRDYQKSTELSEMSLMPDHSSSPSTPSTGSLQSAMKQVGERSSNFIDKIRDAAQKRKVAVTRSRDSLVAKEQEQLRSIAECKTRFATLKQKLQNVDEKNKEATKENNMYQFRNPPQSSKNFRKNNKRNNGFGGVGVPKVEKRPTTTPLSPMLGLRRKGGKPMSQESEKPRGLSESKSAMRPNMKSSDRLKLNGTSASRGKTTGQHTQSRRHTTKQCIASDESSSISKSKSSQEEEEESFGVPGVFKALPFPSSSTRRWNAGQLGIPKVSKRAVTVPVSPCLGPKRQSRIIVERCDNTQKENSKFKIKRNILGSSCGLSTSSRSITMSPSSVMSSPLLGLTLIHSTKKEKIQKSEPRIAISTQKISIFKPFIPRSTDRANMRKQFDIYRVEKRSISLQEKREKLRSQIKVIHRELKILSKDLT